MNTLVRFFLSFHSTRLCREVFYYACAILNALVSFISLAHSCASAILLLPLPFIPCPQFRASFSFLWLAGCRLYASLLIIRFILWSDLVPDRRILLFCSRYFLKFLFLFLVVLFRRNVKKPVCELVNLVPWSVSLRMASTSEYFLGGEPQKFVGYHGVVPLTQALTYIRSPYGVRARHYVHVVSTMFIHFYLFYFS